MYNAWVIQELGFKDRFVKPSILSGNLSAPVYGTPKEFDDVIQSVIKILSAQANQFNNIYLDYKAAAQSPNISSAKSTALDKVSGDAQKASAALANLEKYAPGLFLDKLRITVPPHLIIWFKMTRPSLACIALQNKLLSPARGYHIHTSLCRAFPPAKKSSKIGLFL